MIREEDLHEAIAECLGKKNPDANTCIKLASFYTILDQLYPKEIAEQVSDQMPVIPTQSFSPDPDIIDYEGDSEFAQEIRGRSVSYIMPIIDELMQTLQVLQPRLYDAVMRRIIDQ